MNIEDTKIPEEATESLDILNKLCADQPSLYVHYALLCDNARYEMEVAEQELETRKSEVEMEYRKTGIPGIRKSTESLFQSAVKTDVRYKYQMDKLLKAKKKFFELKSVVEAMSHKKFMLSAISANIRKEREAYE